MPEVTLTTYILSFAVVLAVIPFGWAMFEYRSLPESKRPSLGVQGVGTQDVCQWRSDALEVNTEAPLPGAPRFCCPSAAPNKFFTV